VSAAESPWPARVVTGILERLAETVPRTAGTRVLAIDGRSGAGKTTLSAAVAAALRPRPPIVHLEDIYPGWDGLAASTGRLLDWVLDPLARGEPARLRRYDWNRDEYADWVEIPVTPVLIVEGVGCGVSRCAPYLSLLVYLDAPEPVRFARAMTRDGEGYRRHWKRWAEQERRQLAEGDPRGNADLIIDAQPPGVG